MKQKIIFATGNEGKVNEVRMILGDMNVDVFSLKDLGIDVDIIEDGSTFEENAIIKAREISKISDGIVLADDSGLEVDYLNKEPGIYSARFGGEDTPYHIKNQMLIERLEGVVDEQRTARFVCVIAAILPDGTEITTRDAIEGRIGYEERGENGFGYDPIFYVPQYDCTTAELTPEQKNEISHRGKALQRMKEKLEMNNLISKKETYENFNC